MSQHFPLLDATRIKQCAHTLGFSACGIARASEIDEVQRLRRKTWIERGMHGTMSYLEKHEEKRADLRLLVEGARCVVSVALNYYLPDARRNPGLAMYAQGKDYHDIMKSKLNALHAQIAAAHGLEAQLPNDTPSDKPDTLYGRAFCDTAPIDERYWAERAGIGWRGKSGMLVVPKAGNWFFLGELVLCAEASAYNVPMRARCGSCTACMDACPTGALTTEGLDARQCLSYLTIEHRGALPQGMGAHLKPCFYGCDRCAAACPWNRFATPTMVNDFQASPELLAMTPPDWHALTIEQYRRLFKGSAVKRAKFEGLKRNIDVRG